MKLALNIGFSEAGGYKNCAAKRIVAKCVKCRRTFGRPLPPLMAQLPKHRASDRVFPFANTGIDFFGPFWVTMNFRLMGRRAWDILWGKDDDWYIRGDETDLCNEKTCASSISSALM